MKTFDINSYLLYIGTSCKEMGALDVMAINISNVKCKKLHSSSILAALQNNSALFLLGLRGTRKRHLCFCRRESSCATAPTAALH